MLDQYVSGSKLWILKQTVFRYLDHFQNKNLSLILEFIVREQDSPGSSNQKRQCASEIVLVHQILVKQTMRYWDIYEIIFRSCQLLVKTLNEQPYTYYNYLFWFYGSSGFTFYKTGREKSATVKRINGNSGMLVWMLASTYEFVKKIW